MINLPVLLFKKKNIHTNFMLNVSGFGRKDVVEYLLSIGANVHACDDGGLIPLHNACSFGHAEVKSYRKKNNFPISYFLHPMFDFIYSNYN